MLSLKLRTEITNIVNTYFRQSLTESISQDRYGDAKTLLDVLNNISIENIGVDNAYKLEKSIDVTMLHDKMTNSIGITRMIKALIDDGVLFTALEQSAIKKIFQLVKGNEGAYDSQQDTSGTTIKYDITINYTLLSALVVGLAEQRTNKFSGQPLEKIPVREYDSVNIGIENDALLAGNGLYTLLTTLKLYVELLQNVHYREISGRW